MPSNFHCSSLSALATPSRNSDAYIAQTPSLIPQSGLNGFIRRSGCSPATVSIADQTNAQPSKYDRTYGHCYTAQADIWAQSLAYPGGSPESAKRTGRESDKTRRIQIEERCCDQPRLVTIQPGWKDAVDICAGANEKEHDQKERLEFEDAEHGGGGGSKWCLRPGIE